MRLARERLLAWLRIGRGGSTLAIIALAIPCTGGLLV
jgi:hypothetical protein